MKKLYASAVNAISMQMGKTTHEEYKRLLQIVKKSREMEAEAQALLDEHVRSHKC